MASSKAPGSNGPNAAFEGVLTVGLGTAVAVWAIGYLALLNPSAMVGEALFGAMLLCMLGGGYAAGRLVNPRWISGLKSGAISAAINLLIIGSLVSDQTRSMMSQAALWWAPGLFIASMALGALGAAVGARRFDSLRPAISWPSAFAGVAGLAVFLLLITGGVVTGWEAGLAVPDWPNSFGHNMILYPLGEMLNPDRRAQGVHFEHAHRLYGMLVGLASILLVFVMWRGDSRPAVRWAAALLLLAVIFQGVLGGTRVTEQSLGLAIVHGVFGQMIFAGLLCLSAACSRLWRNSSPSVHPAGRGDRRMSTALLIVMILQLVLGAMYRHGQAMEGIPAGMLRGFRDSHITFAIVVLILAIIVGIRAMKRGFPVLRRHGARLHGLVTLQILLGVAGLLLILRKDADSAPSVAEVAVTTAHQATGALLLAVSALTAAWTRRLLGPA